MFGRKGYDGVSTREIAAAADVPPPSLQYYFENKQGLYLASLDHVQEISLVALDPLLTDIELSLKQEKDIDFYIDAYCRLLESIVDFFIDTPEGRILTLFALRRDFPSESEVKRVGGNDVLGPRIANCCLALIKRVNPELTDQLINVIAMTINSQMFSLIIESNRIENEDKWVEIIKIANMTKSIIRINTDVILKSYKK